MSGIEAKESRRDRFFGGKAKAEAAQLRFELRGAAPSTLDSMRVTAKSLKKMGSSTLSRRLSFGGESSSLSDSFSRRLSKSVSKMETDSVGFKSASKIDKLLQLSHFLNMGHTMEVTCVCSDIGADVIVTGSKDGTMRLWMLDEEITGCYILFAVVTHALQPAIKRNPLLRAQTSVVSGGRLSMGSGRRQSAVVAPSALASIVAAATAPEVTAVAVIEGEALVVSGTNHGDVFFTSLTKANINVKRFMHRGAVKDLAIRNDRIEQMTIKISVPESKHIDLKMISEDRGFKVKEVIEGGAIDMWNQQNPKSAVQVDDVITFVQGQDVRICAKNDGHEGKTPEQIMTDEIKNHEEVSLTLWRHQEGHMIVASCGGCEARVTRVAEQGTDEDAYVLDHHSTLPHKELVTKVQFIGDGTGANSDTWHLSALYILTCSLDGARLWTLAGMMAVMVARFPIHQHETKAAAVPLRDESMLLSASNEKLCVWDIAAARDVWQQDRRSNHADPEPVWTREQKVGLIDVGLWGKKWLDTKGRKIVLWRLKPEDDQDEKEGDQSPTSSRTPLLQGAQGEKRLVDRLVGTETGDYPSPDNGTAPCQELMHNSPVTALRIVEDPEDGGVLVAGCLDGRVVVTDLEGHDSGEVIGRLRSLTHFEFFGPMIMAGISFLQMNSFAFGPAVHWQPAVAKPANIFTPLIRLNLILLLGGSKDLKFWGVAIATLATMVVTVGILLGDMRKKVIDLLVELEELHATAMDKIPERSRKRSKSKNTSPKKGKEKQRSASLSPTRRAGNKRDLEAGNRGKGKKGKLKGAEKVLARTSSRVRIFRGLRWFLDHFITGCCTLLVVPMANNIAQALSCERDASNRLVVVVAPDIQCFVGAHLNLVVAMAIIAPVYFFLLFPYALVRGDADYIQREELFQWSTWEANAVRKATVMHLGPMHPKQGYVFRTVCADIGAKIALPVIAKLTITAPQTQMMAIAPVGFLLLAITYRYPPLVCPMWNQVLIGMRLCTFSCMICALIVVLLDDPGNPIPLIFLPILVSVCALWTVRRARGVEAESTHTLYMTTLGASEAQETSKLREAQEAEEVMAVGPFARSSTPQGGMGVGPRSFSRAGTRGSVPNIDVLNLLQAKTDADDDGLSDVSEASS